MTDLTLPALRADSVLGFLATLGTARLLRDSLQDTVAFGWPDGPYSGAVIRSSATDIDGLVERLVQLVADTRAESRIVPGVTGLPPGDDGTGRDSLKNLAIADGRGLATTSMADPELRSWVHGLLGLVPPIDPRTGLADKLMTNRFVRVGPGTVWASRTMADALSSVDEVTLKEAFVGWRRYDGYLGAYLDHRADVDKSTGQTKGGAEKRGVPGATFLALMALPLFPVRSVEPRVNETVGWSTRRGEGASFQWPVWSRLLGVEEAAVLVDHPATTREGLDERRLPALGVTAVFRSARLRSGNYNAAMAGARCVWETQE